MFFVFYLLSIYMKLCFYIKFFFITCRLFFFLYYDFLRHLFYTTLFGRASAIFLASNVFFYYTLLCIVVGFYPGWIEVCALEINSLLYDQMLDGVFTCPRMRGFNCCLFVLEKEKAVGSIWFI